MISMGLADINQCNSLEKNLCITKERLDQLAEYVVRHKDDSLTDFLDLITHEREGFTPIERSYLAFKVGYAVGTFHGDRIRAMQVEEEVDPAAPQVPTIIIFRRMPE